MGRKAAYGFLFRNRCPSSHPGDYHALGHAGKGIFHPKGRCRTAEGTYARTYVIWDSLPVHPVHLLPDSPIQTRVTCVQAHHGKPCLVGLFHNSHHLFQRHPGAVVNSGPFPGKGQKFRIHQGTGINNHVSLPKKPLSPYRYQVRAARSCSYYMHH